jgi:hypothetical protein
MRTISLLLCLVCIGCTAVSPPATMMLTPAPTPTLAVTAPPMPVKGPQEPLLQAVVKDDDEVCSSGMGD